MKPLKVRRYKPQHAMLDHNELRGVTFAKIVERHGLDESHAIKTYMALVTKYSGKRCTYVYATERLPDLPPTWWPLNMIAHCTLDGKQTIRVIICGINWFGTPEFLAPYMELALCQ